MFTLPELLRADHDLASFRCGEEILDDWLRERALDNMALRASRTYVVCREGSKSVVGYYALSMGSMERGGMPGAMRRNMPERVPAVLLGRLAVDQTCQGQGLGGDLLNNAILRSLRAAEEVAAKLMIVHALSEAAAEFYQRHGFKRMPTSGLMLALDFSKLPKLGEDKHGKA